MSSHLHSSEPESENARFDLVLAVMLWIGAVCLICAVSYGATHGVNHQFPVVFIVLYQYYGQWILAGLAVLVGAGMCQSALRRIKSAPRNPEFLEGVVLLESARWFQQTKPRSGGKPRHVAH